MAASLVVAGTLLVDEVLELRHAPVPGSQQRAVGHRIAGGGQVWHTALAARRSGADVTVAGRCGSDATADGLREHLRVSGVCDRLGASGRSRRAFVLEVPGEERTIVSVAGDGDALPPDRTPTESDVLRGVSWLHLDGYGLDDAAGDYLVRLAGAASDAGIPVSMEPPSLSGLPWREARIAELPPLRLVCGRPDEIDAVRPLLRHVPPVLVTHDGPRPVQWREGGTVVEAAVPYSGTPFTTTLGAGDRFTGGLLAAVTAGASPGTALARALDAARRAEPGPR